ncbi:milk fat globule EGF and factor V/VIII domain containing b [Gambusia affinis]|uniref:milk fat globule EGF and factor V/VIII domain containing b n=1 Tax=Gambusia affinis TaxID=33528 RepID=UPI001CDD8D09|nr:milk fat globule EGF and factor V/VIII domain containing b [Gambusia affinis]
MEEQARYFFWAQLLAACLVFGVKGDLCEVNVCKHGGTCVTGTGTPFICICPDGFSGETCNETETGPCSPNPCQNDGVCEATGQSRRGDVFTEYICKCQPGYEGVHCQTNVNDCVGQPCENGGTCRDLDGDFKCHCPSPYVGKHCQLRECNRLAPSSSYRMAAEVLGRVIDDLMEGVIKESQITASSIRYTMLGLQRWGTELARLHNKGLVNAWSAAPHDKNPWIQINMQRTMRFTGIVTQGASCIGTAEFIKAFKVASSLDGRTYTMYRTEGQRRDQVRMTPVSRLVLDRQITASSTFRTWGMDAFTWLPQYARLDKQGKTNAWIPATNSRSEWLQVDLSSPKRITGIVTQGAKDFGSIQFVSSFKIAHSNDGRSWTVLQDETTRKDKIFTGNSDNNVHKKNIFEPPFYSRYVRVLPWEWHERITLRMELLGCDE